MDERPQFDETAGKPARHDATNSEPSIEYQRLRSPREHGTSLQLPPLSEVNRLWQHNRALRSNVPIGNHSLFNLQKLGRRETIDRAIRFTRSYSDIEVAERADQSIVMSGHQPELFHPGVWYKNFVLSGLGERLNATPINLVVDNDICGAASIRYPRLEDPISLGTIPIVPPGPNVPYEARTIEDLDYFSAFQQRVLEARPATPVPIIKRLWPHVLEAAKRNQSTGKPRLGESIAAGRHRLELEYGLKTLEVPVSQIAQTQAFAIFAESVLTNSEQFQSIYNDSLQAYRQTHRIRSRSHPVPELELIDRWREVPFWIWHVDQPQRRRLFVQLNKNTIRLSDRADWQTELEINSFVEQFCELSTSNVAIRPRALMTTMFSRLVLSDLFLHGIGGAKYDQLTDLIIERFYSTNPPGFATLSATMKLPTDYTIVRRGDLTRARQLIRELTFHPEQHITQPTAQALELIEQKRNWTQGPHRRDRSKQKHDAITSLNRQLGQWVDTAPSDVRASSKRIESNLRASEILDSREYSYCLFPDSLMGELFDLAQA